ncbi:MAG: hypothetical protein QG579_448 [Patescibacteria group bacterium]|nr:hypothetical protein [Patescibacteria group bacterium]
MCRRGFDSRYPHQKGNFKRFWFALLGDQFAFNFGGRKFFNHMIYESKSGFIFEKCKFCQKSLNEMEKKFCDEKTVETGFFHQICSGCLDTKCNGAYSAVS